MSIEDNNTPKTEPEVAQPAAPVAAGRSRSRFAVGGLALVGTLIVGVAAGAVTMKLARPHDQQALLPPVAITAMADSSLVAVKGQAVEIFGNKFIIADSTGRALIDTGREGEGGKLVAKDEAVTVQGRFENGTVHASMVVHADGRVDELRPAGPKPHHGWKDAWRDGGPRP